MFEQLARNLRTHWFYAVVVAQLGIFSLFSGLYFIKKDTISPKSVAGVNEKKDQSTTVKNSRFYSRDVVEYVEKMATLNELSGGKTARAIAYITSGYHDAFEVHSSNDSGMFATWKILDIIFPNQKELHRDFILSKAQNLPNDLDQQETAKISPLFSLLYNDGANQEWNGQLKAGERVWKLPEGKQPIDSTTGNWSKWNLKKDIVADSYPSYVSSEQSLIQSSQTVLGAVASSSNEQKSAVQFWLLGGKSNRVVTTILDRFYDETNDVSMSEEQFAWYQKTLAQSMYDGYIVAFKAKYDISTPRPNQALAFQTGIENPLSPSFVSEYATTAGVVENIIKAYLPEKKSAFEKDIYELRNVGYWAGINHEEDERIGFDLGKRVGKSVVEVIGERSKS
jgi:hypothetical protein